MGHITRGQRFRSVPGNPNSNSEDNAKNRREDAAPGVRRLARPYSAPPHARAPPTRLASPPLLGLRPALVYDDGLPRRLERAGLGRPRAEPCVNGRRSELSTRGLPGHPAHLPQPGPSPSRALAHMPSSTYGRRQRPAQGAAPRRLGNPGPGPRRPYSPQPCRPPCS